MSYTYSGDSFAEYFLEMPGFFKKKTFFSSKIYAKLIDFAILIESHASLSRKENLFYIQTDKLLRHFLFKVSEFDFLQR